MRVVKKRGAATLEDAFIGYLEDAEKARSQKSEVGKSEHKSAETAASEHVNSDLGPPTSGSRFSFQRMLANSYRELQELSRDPIRLTLAGLGSVILMIIIGYGITLDVEHLKFAALDRDQTTLSREYLINIAGSSRYFIERPPVSDYQELDRRMRSGELSMVVEIPPDFGRDVERWSEGKPPVKIGVWIDGAMPQRAETIRGYVQGMHLGWLNQVARYRGGQPVVTPATVELRYRYNPDVNSVMAIVPAVIPLLLLLIPAMLATLSVVREKDLGSIINFYVTPTTRLEFLLGKQLPVCRPRHAQLPATRPPGGNSFPRADERRFPDRRRRHAALRHLFHRHWHSYFNPHAHPGGRALRHDNSHSGPGGKFLRADRSGFIADRLRSISWETFTRLPITLRSPAGRSRRRSVSPGFMAPSFRF